MAKSTSKPGVVSALDYLAHPDKHPAASVCAVFGDEAFLKSEVLAALRRQVLGAGDADLGLTTFAGRDLQLRDVRDALSSRSLFGDGQRMVVVEDADSFVTEYRADLEDYVAEQASRCREPSGTGSASARRTYRSILVLDVKTWPSNTRLAKAVAAGGLTIECVAPNERQIKTWLVQRAKSAYGVKLEPAAADALVELVPPELGILVQEITKLALVASENRVIDVTLVQQNVGGWRARAAWDMIDAAADGRAAEALAQLDRLIASGEKPHGLLPQMASTLRRFATAMELYETAEADRRRISSRDVLAQAGVPHFKLNDAEKQLKQIGRTRAHQLTEWLLAADLAIKGHHSSDDRARTEIERLIVRLSTNAARAAAS